MPIIKLPMSPIFPVLTGRSAPGTRFAPTQTDDWRDTLKKAVELHQRGVDGDKEAVKQAHAALESLRKTVPEEDLVEAYYGSATALLGRDAVDPNERFALAIKGLKILDNAVGRAPENTEIRTLRAYVCYRLPETFFHRTETAVADFRFLIGQYERDPALFTDGFHHQLLFDLGKALKNTGHVQEAEQTWRQLLSLTNSRKYGNLVRGEGILVPTPNPGNEPEEATAAPPMGRELHRRALAGDKDAARRAVDFFAQALQESENDPLIQAYHADCISMAGRDAEDPGEMFAAAIKAMKMLDAAVNMEPDNIRIRLLRAGQSLRLPEAFFRRTATAAGDFEYLIERYEKDRTILDEEAYYRLLHDLGTCYHRLGMTAESEAIWKKLIALEPTGKYRSLLAEIPQAHMGRLSRGITLGKGDRSRDEAIRLHDLAVAGSAEAAGKALALWEKAFSANPRDPAAEAYYGSSMALVGRHANEPKDIFNHTIKGLIHLNKAIGRDPSNTELRMLRAYLTYSLPESFFHLTEKAIKDFRFLKNAYEQDRSVFPAEQYHKILYDLGQAYRRTGQEDLARKTWLKLRKLNPGPAYAPPLDEDSGHGVTPSPEGKEDVQGGITV